MTNSCHILRSESCLSIRSSLSNSVPFLKIRRLRYLLSSSSSSRVCFPLSFHLRSYFLCHINNPSFPDCIKWWNSYLSISSTPSKKSISRIGYTVISYEVNVANSLSCFEHIEFIELRCIMYEACSGLKSSKHVSGKRGRSAPSSLGRSFLIVPLFSKTAKYSIPHLIDFFNFYYYIT